MDMKTKVIFLSCALLAMFGTSCRWLAKPEKMEEGLVIVNVLEKKYFDDCRIAGSINIPAGDSDDQLKEYACKNWDKEKTHIVTYCANYKCTASGDSAKMLKDSGFKNVWAYEGGIAEWKHLGYPTEGQPCTQGYLNDYQKSEGLKSEPSVPVIEAEELKALIEKFSSK